MCKVSPNENLFRAIFEDREGRTWLSFEAKPIEDWSPKSTGLSWGVAGAKPWDSNQMALVGLQAKCECLVCFIRMGWEIAKKK